MKTIIGVMGPGEKQATERDLVLAYETGKIVAHSGAVLLCGGMTGVMEHSAKGAREAGGTVVGVCPSGNRNDMNQYIDIPIVTAMHSGRNYMNILSSDIVIFVTVNSPGTLSELAYAIQYQKPSIVIGGTPELKKYMESINAVSVQFVEDITEVIDFIHNS